jgi:predicted kinase
MLIGLVGAGKTTFAQDLWSADPKRTVRSSLDEIIQMMSFYHYEPKLSNFYGGIERSAIIEGLLDGYKVIIDRTNITKRVRGRFITLVKHMRNTAKDFLGLMSGLEAHDFYEHCERNLIEHILLNESREHVSIHTSFLKFIRDWKAKSNQPSLFEHDGSPIKAQLHSIMQTEIVGVYFSVPRKICLERRIDDPHNALRDTARNVDWKAVIRRMAKQLEPPRMEEGFDRLYSINEDGVAQRIL